MSADDLTTRTILVAIALMVGSIFLGFLIRHLLVRRLAKRSTMEGSRADVVLSAMSKGILAWFGLAGIYAAVIVLPFETALDHIVGKLLLAVAILVGTLAAARVTGGWVGFSASRHERLPGATSIFSNIAKVFVLAVGLLVMLQTLGVAVGPLLAALGVGGLAVALALQDTLSNLFGGLQVIASKKVLPGDYVLLDSGEEGYVEDVNWRNTSLRNLRNNIVVVPNSRLASAILTNYYQPAAEMSLLIPVGVSYASNLHLVEAVTKDVGRVVMTEVSGGVPDFDPIVRFHTFDEFSINFNVILRVKEHTDQYLVRHEFVKRLHDRYRDVGIEIPFPIRTVISRDGSDPRNDGTDPRRDLVKAGATD
ncbi:MAG TPA: mechanosensitive ion channel family protein [Actinomycetota bacterium]|nr:mechanosensitive ion channel family protein [Actinomycetota bacterium]